MCSVGSSKLDGPNQNYFSPDVVFYVHGRPIEAHRVILSARSPYFKRKFENDWKYRREVRFSKEKLSYPALYSLLHFFYSDRLEVAVDDMEDLVRICKVCECEEMRRVIEKELAHQKFTEYKALQEIDSSQRRFVLQGLSLPEEDRLPAALHHILQLSLNNSSTKQDIDNVALNLVASVGRLQIHEHANDLADICVGVDGWVFRCHQVVLASRSDYFRTRISRMDDFLEVNDNVLGHALPYLEEHDLSHEAFEKMIEYMYVFPPLSYQHSVANVIYEYQWWCIACRTQEKFIKECCILHNTYYMFYGALYICCYPLYSERIHMLLL